MQTYPLKVIFAGTSEFGIPSLTAILKAGYTVCAVYTQPDRPAGRGKKLAARSPIKECAIHYNLPVFQPYTLKLPETQNTLKSLNADIMIVAAYGLLLPKTILTFPRWGCINIHASLLPRWRGAAPIQRSILDGDATTGISIMQMDAGLDTGEIISQSTCLIGKSDTARSLQEKLADLGAKAILETLEILTKEKTLHSIPQDSNFATYANKINKQEALVNWNSEAIDIERAIRAYHPWPIAYTYLRGNVIRLWEATVTDNKVSSKPGTILNIDAHGLQVACKVGSLTITRLQLPNKKPLSIPDLLNGYANLFQVNEVLGLI